MTIFIDNESPVNMGDIGPQEEVFFTLTPEGVTIAHVWIWAKLADSDETRVIYDDSGFAFPFSTRSQRYELAAGAVRFQLQQVGGWSADIEKIVVCAIDSNQVIGPVFRNAGASAELWFPPETPSAIDEEFNGSSFPAAWSRTYAFSPTPVDTLATFNDGTVRENYNDIRRSYMLLQSAPAGVDFDYDYVYRDFNGQAELPDGLYWARFFSRYSFGDLRQSDSEIFLSMNADGGGFPDPGFKVSVWPQEQDSTVVQVDSLVTQVLGNTPIQVSSSDLEGFGNHYNYAAIIKTGNTFRTFVAGNVGSWVHYVNFTTTFTVRYIGIGFVNRDTTPRLGTPVVGVDFLRYKPELVLP